MLKKSIKRIAAVFAISSFLFTNNIQSVLALDASDITYEGVTSKVMVGTGNLFEGANNLFPGDDFSRTIHFKNNSASDVTFYMLAEESKDFSSDSEKQISKELIVLIKLKLELTSPDGTVKTVYSGPFSGNPEGSADTVGTMMSPIVLGRLSAQQSGAMRATITVPQALNNYYQRAVGKVNWLFYCDIYSGGGDDDDDDDDNGGGNGGNGGGTTDTPTDNTGGNTYTGSGGEEIEITDPEVPLIDNTVDITDPEVPLSDANIGKPNKQQSLNGVNIFVDDKTLGNLPKTGGITLANTLLEPVNLGYVVLISGIILIFINRKKHNKIK